MSIGAKLITTMTVLGLVLLAGLLLVFDTLVIPWQVRTLVDEARSTAAYVQEVYPHIDRADMQLMLERLSRVNPQLSYVLVVDRTGKAIAHSDPGRVGKVFDDPGTLAAARDARSLEQIYARDMDDPRSPHYGERVIDILIPNYDIRGRHVGAISVGLSLARLDDQKRRYYQALGFAAIFLALAMAAVAVWVHRDIVGPIKQIDLATRRIDRGDFNVRLDAVRRDEVGSLARHFNLMSERIASLLMDLRERSVELQDYIDQLTTLNGKLSADGTLLTVNATAARIVGKNPEELVGLKIWDAPWWDRSSEALEMLKRAVSDAAGGRAVRLEMMNVGLDGAPITVDFSLKPVMAEDGQVRYLVAEGRDITARKQIEEALVESERRLVDIINFLPDATFVVDTSGRVTFWNHAVERLTGVKSEDILGKDNYEHGLAFYGDRRPMLIDMVQHPDITSNTPYAYVTKERDALTAEWYTEAIGDSGVHLWGKASPLHDPDGSLIGAIETVRDVTDRKRVLENLRESQRMLATLMGNLPGMAYRCRCDRQYTMNFVSDGCLELTGYPPEALENNAVVAYGDLIHPDDRDMVWDEIQAALAERRAFRFTYRIATASGQEKWVWEQGIGVHSDDGQLVALEGFITDITERKRADEEKRAFYRETIRSVTQGKLMLVSAGELAGYLESAAWVSEIRSPVDTSEVRQGLYELFKPVHMDEDRLVLFLTGVGEAMTNAIKHAKWGRVYAGTTSESIWVAVSDNGPGIGALTLPKATLRRGFSSKVSMGMGYSIMLDASDSIMLSTGSDGTTVLLEMCVAVAELGLSLDDLPDVWGQLPDA